MKRAPSNPPPPPQKKKKKKNDEIKKVKKCSDTPFCHLTAERWTFFGKKKIKCFGKFKAGDNLFHMTQNPRIKAKFITIFIFLLKLRTSKYNGI